jgi:hypothetical protein
MILITKNGYLDYASGKTVKDLSELAVTRKYQGKVPEATGTAVRKVYYNENNELVCEIPDAQYTILEA